MTQSQLATEPWLGLSLSLSLSPLFFSSLLFYRFISSLFPSDSLLLYSVHLLLSPSLPVPFVLYPSLSCPLSLSLSLFCVLSFSSFSSLLTAPLPFVSFLRSLSLSFCRLFLSSSLSPLSYYSLPSPLFILLSSSIPLIVYPHALSSTLLLRLLLFFSVPSRI